MKLRVDLRDLLEPMEAGDRVKVLFPMESPGEFGRSE